MDERWKPIRVDKRYEVSTNGRIRRGSRIMSPPIKKNGYRRVTFWNGGNRIYRNVHGLVLEAFVGPRPDGCVCRHLDGNKLNNCLANLVWGSQTENIEDARRHGTLCVGAESHNAKLTDDDVVKMREMRDAGASLYIICERFRISPPVASMVCNRKAWTHVE